MTAIKRILHERQRQIEIGWTLEHDDQHVKGEIAWAAVCYAAPGEVRRHVSPYAHFDPWPWEPEADKRDKHDRLQQLTIAGALIIAELDRLLREHDGREEA